MNNEPSKNIDATQNENFPIEDAGEDPDRISILQWILLFAVLGGVIYFSPVLFKLLPK